MPVPNKDIVCHFIRQSEWSEQIRRPKARSLRDNDLSAWHERQLAAQGATLDHLRFGEFAGAGKLKLTAGDYLEIAEKVALKTGATFQLQVEWRPEDEFVGEAWHQWRDAHVQVEMLDRTQKHFPSAFRDLVGIMGMRKEGSIPPDLYAEKP